MTRSVAATVGNGRVLARIGRDGSVVGLSAPSLDSELVEKRIHAVINGPDGERRLKLAATLLMTLPGTPIIYYGTEVGVSQRYDGVIENAVARLPMLWGSDQDQDLLAHFQQLGRMRAEFLPLRRGDRRTVLADKEVFAYARAAGDESVTVALNLSERPQSREVAGQTIELEPLGSVVIRQASTIST